MKAYKISIRLTAVLCIFAIVLTALGACSKDNIIFNGSAFGKAFSVEFSSDDEAVLSFAQLMNEALAEAEKELTITDEDSPLYILNDTKTLYASGFLRRVISDTLIVTMVLDDSVDISAGKLTNLWGFGTDTPHVPDSKKLNKAVKAVSMDKITLATESKKITIADDISIDMSAVSTGLALDYAYDSARLCTTPYKLTLGDMLMCCGEGPSDGKWTTVLKAPLSDGEGKFAELSFGPTENSSAVFISTTDITKDQFTEDGRAYHSTLDPRTGYPPENDIVSVTVVAEAGIHADALSDALLVTGFSARSLSYLRYFSAEAVFLFSDNTYYVTDGLKDSLEVSDSSFTPRNAPEGAD